jgi:hypothetical protein
MEDAKQWSVSSQLALFLVMTVVVKEEVKLNTRVAIIILKINIP